MRSCPALLTPLLGGWQAGSLGPVRRLLGLCVALLLFGSAAAASAFTEVQRDAPWMLLGISADGRSLDVGYQGGGCLADDGRPRVVESARRVVVTLRQTVAVPAAGEGCTADLRLYRIWVSLDAPLHGRRVRGGPRFREHFPVQVVPRVIGMDRRDAIAALRASGLRARTVGRVRRGRVIEQHPRAGVAAHPKGQRRSPAVRLGLR